MELNDDGTELFAIDRILKKRIRNNHPEYLVHFKGYPDSHNQWEALTPTNRHTWADDWSLLFAFDNSVGTFVPSSSTVSLPNPCPPRRSVRFRSSFGV